MNETYIYIRMKSWSGSKIVYFANQRHEQFSFFFIFFRLLYNDLFVDLFVQSRLYPGNLGNFSPVSEISPLDFQVERKKYDPMAVS